MKRNIFVLVSIFILSLTPSVRSLSVSLFSPFSPSERSLSVSPFSPFSPSERGAGGVPDKQVVVLSVDIHCQGCIDKIMKNIAFEKGVKDIVCDLKTKTVTVTYNPSKTDVPTLLKAFEKIKKPATVVKSEL